MRKITLFLFLCLLAFNSTTAQTLAWSSDLEDLTGWGTNDLDMDGNDWAFYADGLTSFGFSPGAVATSASWIPDPEPSGTALTPDNLLFTPVFDMSATAVSISFKMKVGSPDTDFFAENFAVLVYDDADFDNTLTVIYEERLTEGGDNTAKDITASIPVSFAGKTIGIVVRHYDCTDQVELLIDDLEVSYTNSLSVKDNTLEVTGFYPNPVKNIMKIDTKSTIESASITNQLGQVIMTLEKNGITNNTLDLSGLKNGLYFVTIKSEERRATIKIIKQ